MLTTSQAYTIFVTRVGVTKSIPFDDFAVWWATKGKIKVVKAITRFLSRGSDAEGAPFSPDPVGELEGTGPAPWDIIEDLSDIPADGEPTEGDTDQGTEEEGSDYGNIDRIFDANPPGQVGTIGLSQEVVFDMILSVFEESFEVLLSGSFVSKTGSFTII